MSMVAPTSGPQTNNYGSIDNHSTGSGNHFPGANIASLNIWHFQQQRQDSRNAFCRDLRPPPYVDQKASIDERIEGTCEWCVRHHEFGKWERGDSSKILWISADPGCGKSVLARYLVEKKLPTADNPDGENGKTRIISYFFFKDGPENQNNMTVAMKALLHQIFCDKPELLKDESLQRYERTGSNLFDSFAQLWDILTCTAEETENVEILCVLDALDECKEDGRDQFFAALKQLYKARKMTCLRFLLTSRPLETIEASFSNYTLHLIHLSGDTPAQKKEIQKEIDLVIDVQVERLGSKLSREERDLLTKKLKKEENRTYIWVDVIFKLMWKDVSDTRISKLAIEVAITTLPTSLYGVYERILSRTQDPNKAKEMLRLVATAARPLSSKELRAALTLCDASWSDGGDGTEPQDRFKRVIRNITQLLLSEIDGKVHLLHRTVKEFLLEPEPKYPDAKNAGFSKAQPPAEGIKFRWRECISPAESHQIFADICLKTLDAIQSSFEDLDANQARFFTYSSESWAFHVRSSSTKLPKKRQKIITQTILRICDPSSASFEVWFSSYWKNKSATQPRGFTALMTLSYFGLTAALKQLIGSQSVDMNARDEEYGRTALSWASGNGHEKVVRKLTSWLRFPKSLVKSKASKRIRIDCQDLRRRTTLFYAVWSGNVAVVRLLLDSGAAVDHKDFNNATPFLYASIIQNKEILKLMMAETADQDVSSDTLGVVLLSAAERGDEEAVELLLKGENVNLEVENDDGWTALMVAAQRDHPVTIERLARAGANLAASDKDGNTALHIAAHLDRDVTVRLLLKYGKDLVEIRNDEGRTPLLEAAKFGRQRSLEVFLEEGADITASDKQGNTALHLAEMNPWSEVLRVLLQTESLNLLEAKNFAGRTALLQAAEAGRGENVKLLLKNRANPEATDNTGATALHLAAYNGRSQVISMLVDSHAAGVNANNHNGLTPLDRVVDGKVDGTDISREPRDREPPIPGLCHVRGARILLEAGASVNFAHALSKPFTSKFIAAIYTLVDETTSSEKYVLRDYFLKNGILAARDDWLPFIDLLMGQSIIDSHSSNPDSESGLKLAQFGKDIAEHLNLLR